MKNLLLAGGLAALICSALPRGADAQEQQVLGGPMLSVPVTISTATTTAMVTGVSGKVTRVYHWDLIATAADNVTWEQGTTASTPCDTNMTALTGAYPLAANGGISVGNGEGNIFQLPAGYTLCLLTSAATQLSGSVSYRTK